MTQAGLSAPALHPERTEATTFDCPVCGRTFKSRSGRTNHLRTHASSASAADTATPGTSITTTFTCGYCGQAFFSLPGLGQHKRHRHPNELNAEHLQKIPTRTRTWKRAENEALLQAADDLVSRFSTRLEICEELHLKFPHRSVEAISRHLRLLNWNEPVFVSESSAESTISISSTTESEADAQPMVILHRLDPALNHEDMAQDWRKPLLQQAMLQIKPAVDNTYHFDQIGEILGLLSADELTLDEARLRLDEHAALVFPVRWRPTNRAARSVPSASHKKKIRKAQYAAIQALYHTRRKDAASTIISGNWKTSHLIDRGFPPGTDEFWSDLLSSAEHPDTRPPRQILPVNWDLVKPIQRVEVSNALREMTGTAPGPDRLSVDDARSMMPDNLAAYFNLLLALGYLPTTLRKSRITLVPKQPGVLQTPSDLRPITVSSVIARCLNKILASRWLNSLNLPSLQFGFLRCDGTFEATNLLDTILRHAREKYANLSLASIDISKAFDTISKDTIRRSAVAFGAPQPLLELIESSYTDATSMLGTHVIKSNRGVRQGDPLSPLLFIMAMDEILQLADPELGFRLGNAIVDGLAYADDLVVLADTPEVLQRKLSNIDLGLQAAGMKINMAKSFSLVIRGSPKQKITAVDTTTVQCRDTGLRALGPGDTFRYLGVYLGWRGIVPIAHRRLLSDALENLTRAPLKPQQRMDLLREHLIPKLHHGLVLGRVHRNTLARMDKSMRSSIRAWLRLPHDAAMAYFHTMKTDGGLGIPSFAATIPIYKKIRTEKLLASTQPVLREMVQTSSFAATIKKNSFPGLIQGRSVSTIADAKAIWNSLLLASCDGSYLNGVKILPESIKWSTMPLKIFPRVYIRATQLRGNTLGTKARGSRGRRLSTDLRCRGRCGAVETFNHISQVCQITHDARCTRHNRLAKSIAKQLRRKNITVLEEPHIPLQRSFCKPDIVAITGNKAIVMDVAVPSEDRLYTTWAEKKQKYGSNTTAAATKKFLEDSGYSIEEVQQEPLVLSMRGFWHHRSLGFLRSLGFNRHALGDLAVMAMLGTLAIYDIYMRGTGRTGAVT